MKTFEWLVGSTKKLEDSGISTARLDCLVLLEDATRKDRSWLLAHSDFVIQGKSLDKLDGWVERRSGHEPLAYIRGRSEFYGREFIVNAHTLEPRPETETMLDLVKTLVKTRENLTIADIGTGSGCIAISVKLEIPRANVLATDIDVKCIETARDNSKKLGAKITFYEGNLLNPLFHNLSGRTKIEIVCANLPYVPYGFHINEAAGFEPRHAIFGGKDGLDLYRQLFKQIDHSIFSGDRPNNYNPRYVLTESLPFQHGELADIALSVGYKLEKSEDFIQVFKFVERLRA